MNNYSKAKERNKEVLDLISIAKGLPILFVKREFHAAVSYQL